MSEQTETVDQPTEEPTPEPDPAQEPDWKAEARKWEKRAKDNSDAAARLAELEDAQKSEQQKLQEQLEQERQQARQAAVEAARYRAAMSHGLSADDLDWLGDDPEQIEVRAERLASRLAAVEPSHQNPPRKPVEKLQPGTPGNSEEPVDHAALAAKIWGDGRL